MQPLMVWYRDFISPTEYSGSDLNAVHFIGTFGIQPAIEEEPAIERWEGIFNLRVDNTTIRLHSVEDDIRLVHLEAKLLLLQSTIEKFILLYAKQIGKQRTKPVSKKTWLNDGSLKSHYTGYCSYVISAMGDGTLSIADCHRTLIISLYGYSVDGIFYPSKNEAIIDDITKAITEAITRIKELRELYDIAKDKA